MSERSKLDVMERIEKLLRLSRSSNEHEAALAAARAAELMIAHQIGQAELESDGDRRVPPGEHEVDRGRRYIQWKDEIAGGLAESLGCRTFVRKTIGDGSAEFSIVVIGREDSVAALKYLYRYLEKEVVRLSNRAWRDTHGRHAARAWKNSFRCGAALVIAKRLREERRRKLEEVKGSQALVRLERDMAEVDRAYDAKGLKQMVHHSRILSDGYLRGAVAGMSVDLGSAKPTITSGAPRLPGKVTR